MSMKRMRTQETALTPFSKLVWGGVRSSSFAMPPSTVWPPTASTTPVAVPLTTLLPQKARLGRSVMAPSGSGQLPPVFSTGSLSPVRADWLRKRSLAWRMRRSAGIMSPADRWTRSPTTSSSMGSSPLHPSRCTQAVVVSRAARRRAAWLLRVSWTRRSRPESRTMPVMMARVA